MSQEDLALQVSKSPEAVSNIERGISSPKFTTLFEIARALGVGPEELFLFEQGVQDAGRQRATDRLKRLTAGLSDQELDRLVDVLDRIIKLRTEP